MAESPFVTDWKARLQIDIVNAYGGTDPASRHVADNLGRCRRIHLACMLEPWAGYIEDGSKVTESRWSKVNCAPHHAIDASDVIVWKRTGGPVYGVSIVARATTDYLGSDQDAAKFLAGCCEAVRLPNDPALVAGKRWLTLAYLGRFWPIPKAVECGKKDRAGWVVVLDRGALMAREVSGG